MGEWFVLLGREGVSVRFEMILRGKVLAMDLIVMLVAGNNIRQSEGLYFGAERGGVCVLRYFGGEWLRCWI
jgi:hypothetical protein